MIMETAYITIALVDLTGLTIIFGSQWYTFPVLHSCLDSVRFPSYNRYIYTAHPPTHTPTLKYIYIHIYIHIMYISCIYVCIYIY